MHSVLIQPNVLERVGGRAPFFIGIGEGDTGKRVGRRDQQERKEGATIEM